MAKSFSLQGWPKAIYIETSILRKLPLHIVEAEMERLLERAELLNTLVVVPESCILEWLPKRQNDMESTVQKITDGFLALKQTFSYTPDSNWGADSKQLSQELNRTTRDILERHHILVIPMAAPKISDLFDRAVKKIRPFEEKGEKGFRDTIHLYSILEHARTLADKPQKFECVILIVEDSAFQHADVQALAKEYGVNLEVISSIRDTIDRLEVFAQELNRLVKDHEDQKVKQYLLENREQISKYITEKYDFPESDLNESRQMGFFPRIQSIDKVEIVEIPTVTRGTLPTGLQEGSIQVAFDAKIKCTVKFIESPPLHLQERTYRVGSTSSIDKFPYKGLGALSQVLAEGEAAREVKVDVPLFGTIQVTLAEKSRVYSNLALQGFRAA